MLFPASPLFVREIVGKADHELPAGSDLQRFDGFLDVGDGVPSAEHELVGLRHSLGSVLESFDLHADQVAVLRPAAVQGPPLPVLFPELLQDLLQLLVQTVDAGALDLEATRPGNLDLGSDVERDGEGQVLLRFVLDVADLPFRDGAQLVLAERLPVCRPDELVERFPIQGGSVTLFHHVSRNPSLTEARKLET